MPVFASAINSFETPESKAGLSRVHASSDHEKIPETYRKFEASVLKHFHPEHDAVRNRGSLRQGRGRRLLERHDVRADGRRHVKKGGIGIAEQVYSQALQHQRNAAPVSAGNEDDKKIAMSMVTEFQRRIFSDTDTKKTQS